mgnify:CR=1 FL=1
MFEDIPAKAKVAFVMFVVGKATSLPIVYLIFKGSEGNELVYLFGMYISLILGSIILSLMASKENVLDVSELKKLEIENGEYMIKVVSGKVVVIEADKTNKRV